MALYVFDACALIALAEMEEGADLLASFLASDDNTCFVHSLNLCEAYYHAHRSRSKPDAIALVDGFLAIGLILRDDMDVEFWQAAGDLKSIHKKVSLADCCAIVLANRLNAELVTSDHHELDTLADQGICKILFFR